MKTIFTLLAGSFLPSIANAVAAHPGAFDMALGILFGLIAGILIAAVMVPPKRHAPVMATISKTTKRKARQAHQPVRRVQPAYTFTPINYEWGMV